MLKGATKIRSIGVQSLLKQPSTVFKSNSSLLLVSLSMDLFVWIYRVCLESCLKTRTIKSGQYILKLCSS
jgi:hypothetical protein